MTVNEKALRKAVRAIEKHPAKWNQGDWTQGKVKTVEVLGQQLHLIEVETKCNTTHCLAGWVVQQNGWIPLLAQENYYAGDEGEVASVEECINMKTGEVKRIPDVAREILGLDFDQADEIFAGHHGDYGIDVFKAVITRETGVTFPEKEEKAK